MVGYYTYLYKLAHEGTGEYEEYQFPQFSKEQVHELFDIIDGKMKKHSLSDIYYAVNTPELNAAQLREIRDAFVSKDLKEEPVLFVPAHVYDFILNYENSSPKEAAKRILQAVELFNTNSSTE